MESSLRAELSHARRQTDLLFHLIAPETLYERPVAERHRLIFYLGHFEAFDWNVLARRSKGENAFHPVFDSLFERGIDPAPDQAPADTPGDWPHLEEVAAYNAKTRAWIDRHFAELQPALIQMAIEHRHMHAETFAYLLHNLPADKKRATMEPARNSCSTPANPMVSIAAGAVTLGKSAEDFAWDNEYLAHEVFVPAFRISKLKISNGEYLEFVREGG
ncbi:MAG TPA: SUMF1/EgtB/PvdO family nonheme iron enzyme, partial [Bryobacteraceae bacterium]|nr:SUMF1/EgtB/PvdO family nonheme iron enzyme [Bryobacteraceae bacterium]